MRKMILLCLCFLLQQSCLDNSGQGRFLNTKAMTIDVDNDRLFIIESNQDVFVKQASSNTYSINQPVIDGEKNIQQDLKSEMPDFVTLARVFSVEQTSELFLWGARLNDDGETVLNEVSVFNFDGENFSVSELSPIVLTDDLEDTNETDDTFSDAVIDSAQEHIFIANTTTSQIYVVSSVTGDNSVAPLDVEAFPVSLALAGDYVYVCHADSSLAQSITAIHRLDLTVHPIAFEGGCQNVAVVTTEVGTFVAIQSLTQSQVSVSLLNTDDFTLTALTAEDEGFTDGVLSSGLGITSTITSLIFAEGGDGFVYGYFAEQDGNVQVVTINQEALSFEHQTLNTSALNYSAGAIYQEGESEHRVYFTGEAGFLLSIENILGELNLDLES